MRTETNLLEQADRLLDIALENFLEINGDIPIVQADVRFHQIDTLSALATAHVALAQAVRNA